MTRFLLLLLSVVTIVACKPGIPKDIVQPAEMEKILYDIHILDGYVGTIPTPDSAKKVSAPLYKGIFKKYGIDSTMHAKSMDYYYKRPDILSKMYDRISQRLTKTKDDEVKRQEKEAKLKAKKAADSAKLKAVDSTKKAVTPKPNDSISKVKPVPKKIIKFKKAPQS